MDLNNNKKFKIIFFIILALVFGLGGGIVGEILTRVYILEKAFNVPLLADVNLQNKNYGSNLIIRNPNKVIVEQNTKINEVLNSTQNNFFGIFLKKENSNQTKDFDLNNFYYLQDNIADAFVFTSDGWLLSDFTPKELRSANKIASSSLIKIYNKFLLISQEGKKYQVDKIIPVEDFAYSFWHIKASDLAVKKFTYSDSLQNGEILLLSNWSKSAEINSIFNINPNKQIVKDTKYHNCSIILNQNPKDQNSFFAFNLNNEFVALIAKNKTYCADDLLFYFDTIIKNKTQSKITDFGINYIMLSDLIETKQSKPRKTGALIYADKNNPGITKNSPADLNGLRVGDIIISVNNTEVNKENDLNWLLYKNIFNKKLRIEFIRNKEKQIIDFNINKTKKTKT